MDILLQDITYAFRMYAKLKCFNAVAVLTLAPGIGANMAIFSLINPVLPLPLPYHDPDRLVQLWESESAPGNYPLAGLDCLDRQAQNQALEAAGLFTCSRVVNASGAGLPESLTVGIAAALALNRVPRRLPFGVSATDLQTFAAVVALLAAVALAAR